MLSVLFGKNCKVEINFLAIFGPFGYVVEIDFLSGEGENFTCCVVIIEFCIFDGVFFAVKFDFIFRKCENSAAVFARNSRCFTENKEFRKICFQCSLFQGRFDNAPGVISKFTVFSYNYASTFSAFVNDISVKCAVYKCNRATITCNKNIPVKGGIRYREIAFTCNIIFHRFIFSAGG